MLTLRRLAVLAMIAGLPILCGEPAVAQTSHGEITTVSGSTLNVQLDSAHAVEAGTVGRVVEMRTVGDERVQMSFAILTVRRVDRPFDGPWTAVCQITRQSEDLQVGDRVQFEAVHPRPRIQVRTVPSDVRVLLDSVAVGTTPLDGAVAEGRHRLRLEREGYYSRSRVFRISRDETRTFVDTLQTARGTLVVNTMPDSAAVDLDGESLGNTPISKTLQSGTYPLLIEREGFLPVARSVTIPSGGEERINVDLRRPLKMSLSEEQADPVVNARLSRDGERLVLQYDLVGDAEAYEVQLEVSTNGGETFEPLPETVAGAVGERVVTGRGQQIVWSVLEDFPKGFAGSGNRLRIVAEPAGGNGLYWVLGSALAAGAGTTVAAVLGVFGGGGSSGGGGGDLPTSPPGPPQ
jgi:hypothetical protein